jgi:uncharacterized membrane protein
MQEKSLSPLSKRQLFWLVMFCLALAGVIVVWLLLTPAGLDQKLWALAYAVCHQNPDHTLSIGGKLLPLCARCTGMYLGSLTAFIVLTRNKRGSEFPRKSLRWGLVVLALFFIVDGINSVVYSLKISAGLYTPSNVLRLFSGLGMGVVIANLLVPLWRHTFQMEPDHGPVLNSWVQFVLLLVIDGLLGALILFGSAWVYYPAAILSTLMIPFLLTVVYTLLWILIFKKENSLRNFKESVTYIALGCLTALLQIGLFDLLRLILTKTWAGIQF